MITLWAMVVFVVGAFLLLVHSAVVGEETEEAKSSTGPVVNSKPWQRHVIDASLRGADGVKLADVNGNGLPDITTGWEQSGVTRVYINPGSADVKRSWNTVTVGAAPFVEDAVFADLDSDGNLDVVSSTEGNSRTIFVHWAPTDSKRYLESESWTTQALPASRHLTQWMFSLPQDVDGRNGIDLIAGSKGPDALIGWFQSPANPRDLSSWKFRPLAKAGWIMSLIGADMDGDGDEDILFSDRRGEQSGCFWLENPGAGHAAEKAWKRHAVGALGREVMFLAVADLDRDGLSDVLAAIKPREISYLRRLDARGKQWESHSIEIPRSAGTAKAVAVGDMDLDGRLDVVFSCEEAREEKSGVMWLSYRNSPTERIWQSHDISGPEGVKYDLIELIDLDQDGDLDLVTCEETALLGLIWYENPHR